MTEEKKWYNLTVDEVLESLNSSPQGLSHEEAQKRLEQFGPNELAEKGKVSAWALPNDVE